jgi:hypothetical protein
MAAAVGGLPAAADLRHVCPSLLTVVVTTSPIVSHPSTLMLDTLLASFRLGASALARCSKIIVCDGYNQPDEASGGGGGGAEKKKKRNPRYRRRKNISEREAANYEAFVRKLRRENGGNDDNDNDARKDKDEDDEDDEEQRIGSRAARIRRRAAPHTKILSFGKGERLGFALALKEALALVETEFVMVVQHDWAFLRPFPLERVLRVMQTHPEVKYVGLPSTSSLTYAETASVRDPGLRSHMTSQEARFGLPLYPLLFWFDKTHVARTKHYRMFVFGQYPAVLPSEAKHGRVCCSGGGNLNGSIIINNNADGVQMQRARFKRGDFIEDTLGHRELADIRAHGFLAHAKYGTFLYDDGSGEVIAHLDGRRFLTPAQRERQGIPRHVLQSGTAYVRVKLKAKAMEEEQEEEEEEEEEERKEV